MAQSIRDQLVGNAVAALSGPDKPVGLTVHRSRTVLIDKDTLPALVVYPVHEATERYAGKTGPLNHSTLRLRLESRVSGDPADQALDPLLVWAIQALMADVTLGGLAINVQETEKEWSAQEADQVYGANWCDVLIDYVTLAADPTRQA